ncbi:Zn-dependent exopeptidase [Suhomyces tanzawaensis NRRL Y-17324]|uniref:Zn-dependent exopeptidase n=1 Tax=Suhomyces tanzawaensis NRRL Y-17324 TaxID=984487 RepID=A0A1E4SDX4_9ASCO|nr:Zn-dependent exopeptidase [Suhomyces tanzawaensis NRRL Y-17324]ODV77721.1 Zn-dependent exopeptidase [Suhomyces tanzawaensis NRRL Y-17324]
MVHGHAYEQLDSSDPAIPAHPPNYADLEANTQQAQPTHATPNPQHDDDDDDRFDINHNPNHVHFEQFEIGDDDDEQPRDGFLKRASLLTKKFATKLNNNIIYPINQMVDPMYEAYKHFHMLYEQSILKIGNPLVVKRLFYVFFITIIVFFITRYDTNDGVNGSSGGTFSSGKFYDLDKLAVSIKEYIDPKLMQENLEYFSLMPHITGSKGDLTLARFIQQYMDNNGVKIIDFNELQSNLNYPSNNNKDTYLKLSDGSFSATLFESNNQDMEFLSFNPNALNTKNEIEQYYVYGNFGSPEDFQKLKENNIELEDCILLIKYGGNTIPEANKLQLAQSFGVKAIVFISPDYNVGGNVIDDAIQRSNVGLTRSSPGDVLTPGWSSDDGYVNRLPWYKSSTTPKLPSLPISSKDGNHLIWTLKDGVKFEDGHYSGSGKSEAKIKMKITNIQRPTHQLWNVVGSIKGREQAEKGIVIGAARDSGCYGTIGSNTGTVVLLEMIKIFTSLQRQYQWSPSRSIYFVSFDATEYNLAGLAEWIENRRELLKREGYAYIDLSDAISGDDLSVKSHPFLNEVIKNCLRKVKINDDSSLYDLYKKSNKNSDEISNNMIEMKNYLPFINLVNMPSMEIKFTGKKYPRNSCYDNFNNFEKSKVDPSMEKHSQLVEFLSLLTLHLADDPIIPYNFEDLTKKLTMFTADLERHSIDIKNSLNSDKPAIDVGQLRKSIEEFGRITSPFKEWVNGWKDYITESAEIEPSIFAMNRWKWHDNMLQFNQAFLAHNMQQQRPGFMNLLMGTPFSAPENSDDRYEWNSFPSIRDNLINGDFQKAQQEILELSAIIIRAGNDFVEF